MGVILFSQITNIDYLLILNIQWNINTFFIVDLKLDILIIKYIDLIDIVIYRFLIFLNILIWE